MVGWQLLESALDPSRFRGDTADVSLGVAAVRVIALSTRMALSALGALADAAGPLVRDPLVANVIALARTVGVEVVRAVGLAGVEEPADLAPLAPQALETGDFGIVEPIL